MQISRTPAFKGYIRAKAVDTDRKIAINTDTIYELYESKTGITGIKTSQNNDFLTRIDAPFNKVLGAIQIASKGKDVIVDVNKDQIKLVGASRGIGDLVNALKFVEKTIDD